jgi:hypothetical protein
MLLVVVYAFLVFKFFPATPFAAELSDWTYVIIAGFPIFATFIGGLVTYGTTAEDPNVSVTCPRSRAALRIDPALNS